MEDAAKVSTAATTQQSPARLARSDSHDFTASSMRSVFIGISGLIGAGKSTLAKSLADKLQLPVHYEPVKDNEYLADFYGDIKKYSFAMQVYLLNKRFQQQQQIIWQGQGGVLDRTIYEDGVFARMLRDSGHLDERDYRTYMELFQNMSNFMQKPNIIVHLDVSAEESYRRIQMRSRDCESGVPLAYLQGLHAAYEVFIQDISRVIPVIRVDYQRFQTAEDMAKVIKSEYAKIANIRTVTFNDIISNSPSGSPDKKKMKTDEDAAADTTVRSLEKTEEGYTVAPEKIVAGGC